MEEQADDQYEESEKEEEPKEEPKEEEPGSPGPRAAQSLMLSARAWALLNGRLSPSVQDVLALAVPVLAHRMALRYSAQANGVDLPDLIRRIADQLDQARVAA